MSNDEIAGMLLRVSSAAGVAHTGTYSVRKGFAEIVLHHRLPKVARRKMLQMWNKLIEQERNPPTLRIRTHRFAMSAIQVTQ